MTTTDPATHAAHAEGQHDTAPATRDDTFLDYAAREYTALAAQPARMPMDVEIAATIGAGYEVRALRDGVELLTAAIKSLEAVYADATATIKAALAELASPTTKFAFDEAEDAQRAIEEAGG